MTCNNCKTENETGMKFCHCCGKPLELSTIDRYPQLKLKPTSSYRLKKRPLSIFLMIIYTLVTTVMSAIGVVFCIKSLMGESDTFNDILPFFIIPAILLIILGRRWFRSHNLNKIADYFQTTNKKYVFIIKNGKFGVYNRNKHKIQIPCEYTYLQWKPNVEILIATTPNGETFYIDIYNNKLK